MRQSFGLLVQIIGRLHAHPEFRRRVEELGQAQGGIGRDGFGEVTMRVATANALLPR